MLLLLPRTYSTEFLSTLPQKLPLEIWIIIFKLKYDIEKSYFRINQIAEYDEDDIRWMKLRNHKHIINTFSSKPTTLYSKFLVDIFALGATPPRSLCNRKSNYTPYLKKAFQFVLNWNFIWSPFADRFVKNTIEDIGIIRDYIYKFCCQKHMKETIRILENFDYFITSTKSCINKDKIYTNYRKFMQYLYNYDHFMNHNTLLRNYTLIIKPSYKPKPIILHELFELFELC